jgi:hypothetical protein
MPSRAWSRLLSSFASLNAMLKVKLGRPALKHILSMVSLLGRRVNLSVVKVCLTTLATLYRLRKDGGNTFLVLYLKGCYSLLQQYIGGQRLHDLTPFGARVGRTHSGCPSIIPAIHRRAIRQGDEWTIRFWLTIFSLYRVLDCPPKLKVNSISDGTTMDPQLTYEFSQFISTHFLSALKRFGKASMGRVRSEDWSPLSFMKGLKALPFMISKSSPAVRGGNVPGGAQATSPAALLASAHAWMISPLLPYLRNWCEMTNSLWVINRIEQWGQQLWVWEDSLPLAPDSPGCPCAAPNPLGRLGVKEEPAGKVRVFAMVDPFTQWLFDKLHRRIFELLSLIPQDGTFDQVQPIYRLFEWKKKKELTTRSSISLHSFDLSSATDRIPIVLQKVLLSPYLTSWGAELWASLLIGRKYHCGKNYVSIVKGKKVSIPLSSTGFLIYGTGQPMGALSSWAMLAFIHHAFVQWSAFLAGKVKLGSGWFAGYAILGDDVVIASQSVAKQYAALMCRMGVGIGAHKSMSSGSGSALEFAKRTFFRAKDVSGISFREFVIGRQSFAGLLELIRKYSLSLGQTMSVLGYGFRAKANISKRLTLLPKRLRNYILAYYGPLGPGYKGLAFWLPMKSIAGRYASVLDRVEVLTWQFFKDEISSLLSKLDDLQPLLEEAKRLGTVKRDREHYMSQAVSNKAARSKDLPSPVEGGRTDSHPGIERTTPLHVIDSLNETVYRGTFLDTYIAARDLRTKLEEMTLESLDWGTLESLWEEVRNIESLLGSLPLPRNIHKPIRDNISKEQMGILKKWYRYSSLFRRSDNPPLEN